MYESFFGLTAKPFQLNPDPSFLFGSRGHRRALAYLEYGLHQGEGFIVITGDVGAGKTTLVRSLLERLNPDRIVAANLVSTQLEASDVLRLVATAFGVPSKGVDKADLLLALETFLVQVAADGKRALLVVDEAQNLSLGALEELRMLSNFQIEDHALLQSFLIGQPEFRNVMQSPQMQQLRQRVTASYHLGPLDASETQAYILHRLRHVGWKNDPSFAPDMFGLIYNYTGGIPRRINSLCDRLLLAACIARRHEAGLADVEAVITELREEFAEASAPTPPPAVATPAPEVGRMEAASLAVEQTQLDSEDLLGKALKLAASAETRRLEARIVRVEKTVGTALDVLNQLLQRDDDPPPLPDSAVPEK
jgi:putative secretion ATPase (PEP-CTERM system associated)